MRYPAVAGRFYPLDPEELRTTIQGCFSHRLGPGYVPEPGSARRIKAAVVPHAGYMASGPVAAHAFSEILKDGLPEAYIIIGPDHHGVPFDAVMCSDPYITPLGECKVHTEIAGRLAAVMPDSSNAHRLEHSVEVQVPFLQSVDPDPHIVPIIMSRQDPATASRLAGMIRKACEGHDVVILASSDLCHYIPDKTEKRLDSAFLEKVCACDTDGIFSEVRQKGLSVCGYGPIACAVQACGAEKGRLLMHANSWDTMGYDRDATVGYAAVSFE